MSRIDMNHGMRHMFAALAVALGAIFAATTAEARSIIGVERKVSSGAMSLDVTFEAGDPGDKHALYIAYDTEDKGETITDWAELQRGCNVADDATFATIPVSPLLTSKGYKVCRVFLTTSSAPYDTQIEYLRQSGTQYIDTGICPDYTTVAVMDVEMFNTTTAQQRFFAVSADDDSSVFAFDVYINGRSPKNIASACKDGHGDFVASGMKPTIDRLRISLSAAENHHLFITNLVSGATANQNYNTTCTKTSAATLYVFAQHLVTSGGATSIPTAKIAKGARLYSFSMTTNSLLACDYKPCKLGDRVGVYDSVTDTIIYSASGTDFDAANSGCPVACSLLPGEMQLAAAPSATGLFFDYTWRGTAANWGGTDAWTKEGVPATWVEGNNAIFATANATATLAADVSVNSIAFSADATVAGASELSVKSVSVDSGVSATISAQIASAFEKTGAGTLTLTQNRTAATIVKEGTLKMDGATIADLTLGTDGGAPVTFDYSGQELVKNTRDYLVTGSTVTLTNGTFSTASGDDLNIRDDTFTMPSVLTIAKDAVVRQGAIGKSVYIVNVNGTATINVIGGTLGNANGCKLAYLQHKSPDGGLNLNVTEGGLVYFPCLVYALCRGDIAVTSPSLYMTFANSAFSVGTKFEFGSSWSSNDYVPTAPTGVFAATNSVVSVGDGFIVGRNTRDSKTAGSLTVDFENCVVTAKTFAVYYDRPFNNARFNGTRFVFGAASGSFAASDDAANWITVGAGGLTLDTQNFSATLNANLGGSGTVTKVGTGTLTVSRDQATTGGMIVDEGTLAINSSVTFAGSVAFAAGSALDIASYDGTTSVSGSALMLPSEGEGTVTLTLNGGAFGKGVYAIFAAPGVTAADGGKFAPLTGDLGYSWSEADDTLLLTVGDVSGNYWTGRGGDGRMSTAANWLNGVPAAGEDIDLSFVSSATTIIADTGRAFGAVTMGDGVITFTNSLAATSISDTSKVAVAADSTVTLEGNLVIDTTSGNKYIVNSVADGGKFKVTGKIRAIGTNNLWPSYVKTCNGAIEASGLVSAVSGSDLWSFRLSNSGGHIGKWIIGKDGFVCDERAAGFWVHNNSNDRTEIQAAADFTIQDAWIGLSKKASTFTIQTTSPDGIARTITAKTGFAAHADGACNLDVRGSGTFLCDYTAQAFGNDGPKAFSGTITVKDTATLAVNSEKYPTTGAISVSNESTFKVAQSGVVTLSGNLSLADGAALGFNFTNRKVGPLLALASGKSLSFVGEGEKNIAIKVSGDVWPVGGKHILTATGGFNAEGVTVSLITEGAPKWAKSVYVNEDGNIVLDVKPMGTKVIVR